MPTIRTTTVDLRLVFRNEPRTADAREIRKHLDRWLDEQVQGWFGGAIGARLEGKAELSDGAVATWKIVHVDADPEAWRNWL